MANTTALVSACFGAVLSTVGAQAAPASQEEADRLRSVLERYVGHPAPGEAGAVTVAPQGSDYRASFDLQRLARAIEGLGVTVEPATSTLLLRPNDNGTWRVTANASPPVVVHYNGQILALKTSSYRFSGTFDPRIAALSEGSATQEGTTLDQDGPSLSRQRRVGHATTTQNANAAADGSAAIEAHSAFSEVSDKFTIRTPPPKATADTETTAAPVEFSYTAGTGTAELSLGGLHLKNLLEVWAFLVAHPNRDSIVTGQDELRGLLRSALPLMGGLRQDGSVEAFSLLTPMGPFSVRKLGGSVDLSELAAAGKAALGLSLDGLTVPSADLPLWSVGFVPTAIDLKPKLMGFHFDAAAKEAVEGFDLNQNGGFSPAEREKIAHIAWPGDGGRVILGPSRITSGLLDLRLDGEASIGAMPTGHLTINGTGLDGAIAALQSAADTDQTAAQLLTQLVLAKNLAKPNPDGSMTWVVEAAGPGPLTVNGVPLK